MTIRGAFRLFLSILLVWAPAGAAGQADTRIGAVLEIPASVPARELRAMTEEATAIWRPYHVSIDWLTASQVPEPEEVPIVVRMPPSSGGDRRGPATPSRRPLGFVLFVDGAPNGVITLSPETVESAILAESWNGRPLTETPLAVRQDVVGRALGRVLAHELGHYLLAQKGHARLGLMRAAFKGHELVATDRRAFRLQSRELAALDLRLAQLTTAAIGNPGIED